MSVVGPTPLGYNVMVNDVTEGLVYHSDIFDEYRNFTPGNHSLVVRVCGVDIGIAICEDIWQSGGPVAELAKRNIGLMLVPNGSPFEIIFY